MKKLNSFLLPILLIITLFPAFLVESTAIQPNLKAPTIKESIIVDGTNWTVGCFSCHDQTLNYIGMEGFDFSLTNDSMHFVEDGGIYPNPYGSPTYTSVGAYTTFPTINGNLVINFTARARANHVDAVLMGIRIYDPASMTWLMSSSSDPEGIPSIIGTELDSGWQQMTINVTVPECDELAVFWSFNDFFIADWTQEFWVENITALTGYLKEPSDFTPPIIKSLNISLFEENYSLMVNLMLDDENPGYYQIYLNDILKINESWIKNEVIHITFENLTLENYNITLIAYDLYDNYVVSSVRLAIEDNITITPYPILILSLFSLIMISFTTKRNKRRI